MTIFDELDENLQELGDEAFAELTNGLSNHELTSMTLEEAFKIGFAKGVEAKANLEAENG